MFSFIFFVGFDQKSKFWNSEIFKPMFRYLLNVTLKEAPEIPSSGLPPEIPKVKET